MMAEFIGEVIFDMIVEPIGGLIRFIYLRLRGKQVGFKEVLISKNEDEETDNEIKNRVAFLIFMFLSVLIIMIIYSLIK